MKTKIFIITVLFFVFYFPINCYANPVPIYPSAMQIGHALLIDGVADFVVLLIGYLIIRNIRVMASWRFLPYFTAVFIGGLIIDAVAGIFPLILIDSHFTAYGILAFLIVVLTVGVLLFLYNYFLSRRFFKLGNYQAAVIGSLMAILTNPVIATMVIDSI